MKLSRWTSFISLPGDSGFVYNALADSYLVVKTDCAGIFSKIREGKWSAMSPEFVEQLDKAGITVEDDKDEVADLKEVILKTDGQDTMFEIIVNPTLDCNFSCWYCYENHIKGSAMAPETVEGIKNLAKRKIDELPRLNHLHVSFFGGEPLMEFDRTVRPVLAGIRVLAEDKNIRLSVHFTSNSFLLTEGMVAFLKDFHTSFQITLDGGRENHNKTRFGKGRVPTFDIIIDNVRKLALEGIRVVLRINYTYENIASAEEIAGIAEQWPEECREKVSLDFQKVWQDPDAGPEISEARNAKVAELRRRLRKAGYKVHSQAALDSVADSCYGDKLNEAVINYNGDVYACTARDFTPGSRLGRLLPDGRIIWEEDRYRERRESRFAKKICHECRIAPICGGGCKTKCLENLHHEHCNMGYTHERIDDMIIERFEERFMT